jgi:hypothetical protein
MSNTNKESIKVLTRSLYDLQKLRVGTGNRIAGNFRAKLGQKPSSKTEDMDEDAKAVLTVLIASYKRLTDGITDGFIKPKKFVGDEVISSYTELCLVRQYVELLKREEEGFKLLEKTLEEFPIYVHFLKQVKGCGAAMSGVILSEFDIERAQYASSLWKYAGYDVASNGQGRSRKKEHLEEQSYVDKDGQPQKKMGITFNPFLKTKLYVLATCMIKVKGTYRGIYDNYKNRLENMPAHAEKSKGHRNNMAMRYMIKRFLADLYREWRTIEGLPVAAEYSEAKLGKVHKVA